MLFRDDYVKILFVIFLVKLPYCEKEPVLDKLESQGNVVTIRQIINLANFQSLSCKRRKWKLCSSLIQEKPLLRLQMRFGNSLTCPLTAVSIVSEAGLFYLLADSGHFWRLPGMCRGVPFLRQAAEILLSFKEG